jgi:acetyl-CoA C-acetyltransferase
VPRAGRLAAADVDLWGPKPRGRDHSLPVGLDPAKVNPQAAPSSPWGPSAPRAPILVTLLHALRERGRYGCAAICIGGGEATSVLVERLD